MQIDNICFLATSSLAGLTKSCCSSIIIIITSSSEVLAEKSERASSSSSFILFQLINAIFKGFLSFLLLRSCLAWPRLVLCRWLLCQPTLGWQKKFFFQFLATFAAIIIIQLAFMLLIRHFVLQFHDECRASFRVRLARLHFARLGSVQLLISNQAPRLCLQKNSGSCNRNMY